MRLYSCAECSAGGYACHTLCEVDSRLSLMASVSSRYCPETGGMSRLGSIYIAVFGRSLPSDHVLLELVRYPVKLKLSLSEARPSMSSLGGGALQNLPLMVRCKALV